MEQAKKIYIGRLNRFGKTLMVADFTKVAVKDALISEYISTYKRINGHSPNKDRAEYSDGSVINLETMAMVDIKITELEIGKIEWT